MAVEAPPAPKAKAGRHAAAPGPFRPGPIGWVGRGVVYALVAYAVLYLAQINPDVAGRAAGAVTFAIVGLSLNIIIGYTGQLSLGHQGFFGVGAFTAAYVSFNSELGQPRDVPFPVALLAAMVLGAAFALLLGVVALRITGLYLSLITLVFGLTLEVSLFEQENLTGGGAGAQVERPEFFFENSRYYFLCLAILAVVVYIDWRLTRTKTGRALLALRENERVAAAFGVNVTAFKLLAFVLSGALAGLAGALFVYNLGSTSSGDYNFFLGLTFVLMIVVGGLNSRVGVILGSVFFSSLGLRYFLDEYDPVHGFLADTFRERAQFIPDFIGALLLLLTLILNPGGIAQQLRPITRWLSGKKFTHHGDEESGPAAVEASSVRA